MLNSLVLVGRLTKKPELRTTENNKQVSYITLAVPRSFKNITGEYETDFFDCILWDKVASNTVEYCNKGDVVAVKGRAQSRIIDLEDGNKRKLVDIIAEKITFLSSKKKNEDVPSESEIEEK